jgi:hypothetical protein
MTVEELGIEEERVGSDTEYTDEVRHRCRTDHFFLAPLLGYFLFHERIHRPVADHYIKKNKDLPIEQQSEKKFYLHLDPRDLYKTTFGIVDNTQWIVNFPDITILNETATQDLSVALTNVTAKKFWQRPGRAKTIFQRAFPEYVFTQSKEPEDGFYRAPCQTIDTVENTIDSTSVNSTQSGFHPWVMCPDDPVDTKNSGIFASDNSRKKVISNHNTNANLLRRGGYMFARGTRYHPYDLWGHMLRTMDPAEWKTLIRSVLKTKDGRRLIEGDFPYPDEIELQMGEIVNYKECKSKFDKDYQAYMCQQMNDPQGGAVLIFSDELYKQMLVQGHLIPPLGEVSICWRLPYAGKDFMRSYAEGVAVRYLAGRVVVVDAWRGNYIPSELAQRIVETAKRHGTGKLTIERTPGSEDIIPHIYNEALAKNWSIRIDQPEFDQDDTRRNTRCSFLQPRAKSGRLQISTDAGQQQQLKEQFVHFGLVPDNGLIDCISRLANKIPASVMNRELSDEQKEIHRIQQGGAAWAAVYGQGGATVAEDAILTTPAPQNSRNSYGLRPMMGGLDG